MINNQKQKWFILCLKSGGNSHKPKPLKGIDSNKSVFHHHYFMPNYQGTIFFKIYINSK